MEDHVIRVNKLCRICSNRAQTSKEIKKKVSPKNKLHQADAIYILYGIDVKQDIDGIHPRFICTSCYHRIKNSESTGQEGEMNLTGQYSHHMSSNEKLWQKHSTQCPVCDLFEKQQNPRFKKAPATSSVGNPNFKKKDFDFDPNSPNIFHHLTQGFAKSSSISNCVIVLEHGNCEKFKCHICKETLPPNCVYTNCHYFCPECKTLRKN